MATPSLFPVLLKAASGGATQIIQGDLLLQLSSDPDIVLDDEIEITVDEDQEIVIPDDDIEVTINE